MIKENRDMVYMLRKNCALTLVFLAVFAVLPAQTVEKEHLLYSYIPGIRHAAVRDYAWSPLLYSGIQGEYAIGYYREGARSSDHYTFRFAAGKLTNTWDRAIVPVGGAIQTFTFYHARSDPGEGIHWGWSNHNVFQTRDIRDIGNFNNRSEYFTSFGPALRYRLPFSVFDRKFRLEFLGDLQLLGFKLQSSYVTSTPRGFTEPSHTGLAAFLRSIDLFWPGSAWNFGIQPSLRYVLKNGNMVFLNYRYEYRRLEGVHVTEYSSGSWHLGMVTNL
jgi:hypothetical protein